MDKGKIPYLNTFYQWVGGTYSTESHPRLLPEDKFKRFKQLLQAPIETVELCDTIYTQLSRIFDSEDQVREFYFKDEKAKEDWIGFYDHSFWKTKGFEAMRTAINSVWVADLPEVMDGELPEPYGYLIPIESVKDIENDDDNNCQWVIFCIGDYLLVYDDDSIRKYEYKDRKMGQQVAEFKHELGYCPARQMWTDKLVVSDLVNKKSPVSSVLSWMDYYLFMLVNKKYMELSNSYPITAVYSSDDSSKEDNQSEATKTPDGGNHIGAGTFIQVDPPLPGDTVDMMRHPVQLINPDVATLNYHIEKLNELREMIYRSVVGAGGEPENDQAQNEKQILGSFEDKTTVLMKVKRNFEIIETFAAETLARLRYGDVFESCLINYGTKWYLQSLSALYDDYTKAKDSGANQIILESLNESILNSRFKNDPEGRLRAKIITDLTPYPDKEVDELIELNDKGLVSDRDVIVALNLMNFINRFERENLRLNLFGRKNKYAEQLRSIQEVIYGYADELLIKISKNDNDEGELERQISD
jgi:hypothetical protein